MSDKETAPWMLRAAYAICAKLPNPENELGRVQAIAQIIAVECTAPAPQPPMDRIALLVDAVQKFLKHDGGPGSEDYRASEIYHARRSMQAAFGFRCPRCGETLPHLYDENCTDYRAATPQVTPTWKEKVHAMEREAEQASPSPDSGRKLTESGR